MSSNIMDKFSIKKRKLVSDTDQEDPTCSKTNKPSDSSKNENCINEDSAETNILVITDTESSSKNISIKKNVKTRLYQENYLKMGFTWFGDKLNPRPKCVVCGFVLSNEAMVPSKLKRHFSTKHGHLSEKPLQYFTDLIKLQQKQSKSFVKKYTIADRVQEASYLVAEIIAKEMKPHTIGETLIRLQLVQQL